MALQPTGIQLIAQGAAVYIADIGRAQGATTQFVGSLSGAGDRASAASEVMTGALRQVGAVAVDALGQAAQAAGKFVADSVTVAGDFEASVNNLAAVSGSALAEAGFSFDDVSAKALQLGQDTRFSASESIAAMTELVKGGVPIEDVMDAATDATLNLAAASGIQLASAAEIVAKQLGVWSDSGLTATAAADLLTQAANASTVGVEDLAMGLAQAGGTAKTAGVEYEDLVQTMALLAPGFSSAADAGTSLKTFLSRLVPSTTPAKDAMAELGLWTQKTGSAFYDASGAFIGMEEAAHLLKEATEDLSEEQRLQAFNTIFGSDAIRAAAAIASAGATGFNDMGVAMAAAGTAAETAALQNQGFNFAMDSLKGSVETLQIVLGSVLLPILTQFINENLIPGVAVAQAFAQAVLGNSEAFATLSPQLQTAVAGVTGFLAAVQPVVEFVGANLVPILTTLAGVAGGLLVGALVAAIAPFAPLIGAIGLAVAAGAALYGAWERDFGGIRGAVEAAMTAVQAVVTSVVSTVVAFWDRNGADITASAQQWWGQVQEIIGGIVTVISTIVTTVFTAIQSFIDKHGDAIMAVLEFAWNSIESTIDTVLGVVQGLVTTALGVVTGDWDKASKGVQDIVDTLAKYLADQFNNIVKLVQDIGPSLASAAMSVGKSIVGGVADGISAGAAAIVEAAKKAALSALDAAMKALGIKSPSTVFRDQVGKQAAMGLAQGLLDGSSIIGNAATTVASMAVQQSMAAVAAPAASVAGPSINYGGDSYSFDMRGSSLTEAQAQAAFSRALNARTGRADRLARMNGGAG